MEHGAGGQGGKQVMKFIPGKKIELDAEVVESAYDEHRNIQCHALLNNSIVLLNSEFETVQRLTHEGYKKINRLKLNDGLVCVTGEDNAISFYDPKENKAVKKIQCTLIVTSEERGFRCGLQQTHPRSRD